jgi:aryl-alcohol dehydrogenase-like predicted oxidoreductase
MRYRTYKNSDLTVGEIGFGLWTISTIKSAPFLF